MANIRTGGYGNSRFNRKKIKKGNIVDIGHMTCQIKLQTAVISIGDLGEKVPSWSDYKTVMSQKRDIAGDSVQNVNQHSVDRFLMVYTIRYDSAINTTMRIIDVAESRAYRIRGVLNKSHANRYLELEVDGNTYEAII